MKANRLTLQRWWLLSARGTLYILIGATMFIFASTYSVQSGQIIGAMALLAGILQLVFSFSNRLEKNNVWGILHGIADIGFGIAIILLSNGTLEGFVDVLGFWAMMYAFLQAVQAMYAFMAARGVTGAGGISSNSFIHLANVLVAGGLTFTLMLHPAGFDNSMGYIGIFPIALGILIVLLTGQMRTQATM
ncbi:DUF308 domain-containing protein [Spirosoma validum]|uniref:DUF308 domain-containing protein n=1 Tax=Spirosoma validum TaxID=2771355 RepID=A0A927B8D6_9BACT|nr:DUF308 domain-containing protein [Spirosoma validum]MBD2757096.1 DUF308 domain-containing protein [Spirosoma validum]